MQRHLRFLENNIEYLAQEAQILESRVHMLTGLHRQANLLLSNNVVRVGILEYENAELRRQLNGNQQQQNRQQQNHQQQQNNLQQLQAIQQQQNHLQQNHPQNQAIQQQLNQPQNQAIRQQLNQPQQQQLQQQPVLYIVEDNDENLSPEIRARNAITAVHNHEHGIPNDPRLNVIGLNLAPPVPVMNPSTSLHHYSTAARPPTPYPRPPPPRPRPTSLAIPPLGPPPPPHRPNAIIYMECIICRQSSVWKLDACPHVMLCENCFNFPESPTPCINHIGHEIVGGFFRQRMRAEPERHRRVRRMVAEDGLCNRAGCSCMQCHVRNQIRASNDAILCPYCAIASENLVRVPPDPELESSSTAAAAGLGPSSSAAAGPSTSVAAGLSASAAAGPSTSAASAGPSTSADEEIEVVDEVTGASKSATGPPAKRRRR